MLTFSCAEDGTRVLQSTGWPSYVPYNAGGEIGTHAASESDPAGGGSVQRSNTLLAICPSSSYPMQRNRSVEAITGCRDTPALLVMPAPDEDPWRSDQPPDVRPSA